MRFTAARISSKPTPPQKIGAVALRSLEEYAPDAATLAGALGVDATDELSQLIYDRIVEKLRREPVEDFRLDFEDGYGNRRRRGGRRPRRQSAARSGARTEGRHAPALHRHSDQAAE